MLNSEYYIFQACRAAATAWVMLSCTFFTEHIGQEAVLWRQFGYSFGEGNVEVSIRFSAGIDLRFFVGVCYETGLHEHFGFGSCLAYD